jgi:hypothetical protein
MFIHPSTRHLVAAVSLVIATAGGALAHHINGRVYCDSNANGAIDDSDGRLFAVIVDATSQVAEPGAVYHGTSGATGFYSIGLPVRTDTYSVALDASTVPPGSVLLLPPGGTHTVPIVSGSVATDHADDVHFLLKCGPLACASDADCDDADHCTTDRCPSPAACAHDDLPGLTVAWVQCSVDNLRDDIGRTPPCGRKCVKRLQRRLDAIARKLDAATASAHGCPRILAACARRAKGLERRITALAKHGGSAPSATGVTLGAEATRLSTRAASFAQGYCGGR